jgi:hypothetical protein
MSATTTLAPSRAKAIAVARPIPEPPPVTMTVLSLNLIIIPHIYFCVETTLSTAASVTVIAGTHFFQGKAY